MCTVSNFPISMAARGLRRGFAAAEFWDCGFECRRGHGFLSFVSVVCCLVEFSAMGRTLVQRSSVECLCVLEYATITLYTSRTRQKEVRLRKEERDSINVRSPISEWCSD
jgi:hypothetical protein